MNLYIRNVLAVVAGLAVGASANMLLVALGPNVVPPPAGVDVTSAERIAATMYLFEPKHYVIPYLAHAIGTFAGALVAFLVAASHRVVFANVIGVFFLAGGISVTFVIPAPTWFVVLDLVTAYLPMAWIGIFVGRRILHKKLN